MFPAISRFLRPPVLALLFLPAACSGISHAVTLERGGLTANFEGGRLNGPPVEVITVEEDGARFVLESSTFVYEIAPPFQSVQFVASVTLAEDRFDWNPSPDLLAATMREILSEVRRTLPHATCHEPDGVAGTARLESESRCDAQGVAYAMRLRLIPSRRGFVVQFGSWTNERGRLHVERFWRSLRDERVSVTAVTKPAYSPNATAMKTIATRLRVVGVQ